MKRTLAIFAKQPAAGLVKTRLAEATSPAWACRAYEALLLDALDRLESFALRRVIVYDPPESKAYFEQQAAGRFELVPQRPGDLGARLAAFFKEEFHQGTQAVVVIGADSPTLPTAFLTQAYVELARSDVVLVPAMDGGYCLIGCRRFLPGVFEGIAWGTDRVLEQTCERVHQQGLRLGLLPPWYDVDTLADWQMLRGHVAALLASGTDPLLPRTLELLSQPPEK
jgi:uncharacterized protein